MMTNVELFSYTDLMKLVACRMMKKILIVRYSVTLYSYVESFSSNPRNKYSKAEPEQAPLTEPKAEEPPAAVTPAVGLDPGLDTRAEEPVEGAVVSATSLSPTTCPTAAAMLISWSHFSLLIHASLGPSRLYTCHGSPGSNSLCSFDNAIPFSLVFFFF